jgi:hypothetical protein
MVKKCVRLIRMPVLPAAYRGKIRFPCPIHGPNILISFLSDLCYSTYLTLFTARSQKSDDTQREQILNLCVRTHFWIKSSFIRKNLPSFERLLRSMEIKTGIT